MEFRVWTETADFMGGATVHENGDGSAWVEIDPYRYDECPDNPTFPTVERAERFARSECERFMSEARADEPDGVFHIQECD